MNSAIGIGNSFLSSLYLEIQPGNELEVVSQLRDSGHTNLYKVLGHFDLLSLFDASNLDDALLYSKIDGIVSSAALAGYCLNIEGEFKYASPNVVQWLGKTPIVGIINLEIDKWLYSKDSGAVSGMHACSTIISKLMLKAEELELDIAIYGGFGVSEIYALVRTNKLEDIWDFTHTCRSIRFKDCFSECEKRDKDVPIFVNTTTTPVFSYDYIEAINGEYKVSGIEGSCQASILISCLSGLEDHIDDYFKDKEIYERKEIFGINDAMLNTVKNIDTAKFLSDLLMFRSKWGIDEHGPICTRTTLLDTSENKDIIASSPYKILEREINVLSSAALGENNPGLANRLKTFFNNIEYCGRYRVYKPSVIKISLFTNYICLLIDEYQHTQCVQY